MGKLSGLWATLVLAGVAVAQQITVTQGILVPGQAVNITYSNPGQAGKTVQVRVSNDDPDQPATLWLSITLNAQGHGATSWVAANWWGATFNAPGVNEETRFIEEADDAEVE